jgi:hypothetical protein
MEPLQETGIFCPYCGERVTILLDVALAGQDYVEDCEVCCQPMRIRFSLSADGLATVTATRESDA